MRVRHHLREGMRYGVMTCMSAVLSLGIPFALHDGAGIPASLAVAIGLGTAFIVNFASGKLYVFCKVGALAAQFWRYSFVSLAFRISEYLAFLLLNLVIGLQYMIALISVLLISVTLKFLAYKLFVFKPGTARDAAYREREVAAAPVVRPT
jgi:putative flippase GtrA